VLQILLQNLCLRCNVALHSPSGLHLDCSLTRWRMAVSHRTSGNNPLQSYPGYRSCGSGPIFSARSGQELSQIRRYRDRFPANDGLPGADQRKDEPCIPRYEELPESPASLTLPRKHGLERPLLSWLEPFLRSRDIAYSATRPITIIASPRLPSHILSSSLPPFFHNVAKLWLPCRCLIYSEAMSIVFTVQQ